MHLRTLTFAAVFFCASSFAASVQPTVKFKVHAGDPSSSHLEGKFNIGSALGSLPIQIDPKLVQQLLGSANVSVDINGTVISGQSFPFDAKVTNGGSGYKIKTTGLDLEKILSLSNTDGSHTVSATVNITVTGTNPLNGQPLNFTLQNQIFNFTYTVQNGHITGKSL